MEQRVQSDFSEWYPKVKYVRVHARELCFFLNHLEPILVSRMLDFSAFSIILLLLSTKFFSLLLFGHIFIHKDFGIYCKSLVSHFMKVILNYSPLSDYYRLIPMPRQTKCHTLWSILHSIGMGIKVASC